MAPTVSATGIISTLSRIRIGKNTAQKAIRMTKKTRPMSEKNARPSGSEQAREREESEHLR